MLVCHVYPFFPPRKMGGVEKWIFSLSRALSESVQDMRFLLLTDRSNLSSCAARTKKSQYDSLEVYRLGPSLFSAIFHPSRGWPIIKKLSLMQLFHEAVNLPRIKGVDIFHFHGMWLGKDHKLYMELSLRLSRFFNKPLVVSLHGDYVSCEKTKTAAYFNTVPIYDPRISRALKNDAAAITTYSPVVLDGLRKLGLEYKSYLVPNFIDTLYFKRPTPLDLGQGTRVLFVSRLEAIKQPEIVIKSFVYVKKKIPRATLEIVGHGSLYEELQRLIHSLRLDGAVTLRGLQPDLRTFLWNSDVFYSSGYLTLLEAWASGLPVIAPKVGILKHVISSGKNGILVPPDDPEKLAQALLGLMENPKLRKTFSENGMQTVKNCDAKIVTSKVGAIYRSLLRRS